MGQEDEGAELRTQSPPWEITGPKVGYLSSSGRCVSLWKEGQAETKRRSSPLLAFFFPVAVFLESLEWVII